MKIVVCNVDGGENDDCAKVSVTLIVRDLNDHCPRFSGTEKVSNDKTVLSADLSLVGRVRSAGEYVPRRY